MSFSFEFSPILKKRLDKLARKDKPLAVAVNRKIQRLINADKGFIENLKNLRHDKSHLKRVRIKSFVLTFRLNGDTIFFEDFVHHDNAY
ncbi:MAG: hypothetical protein U9Q69_01925 [Nanoarchaeota archaeon]|nr:hypothetical protein [Nanoarchaeota archaeon]